MKADALFVIFAIIFVFAAWVATGGPSRPISKAGLFITPVTRSGEESQGYRTLAPSNPINTSSYPKQVGGSSATISSGSDNYQRQVTASGARVLLEHSTLGPASGNPNAEYVSLVNYGAATTSTAGWTLTSKATGAWVTLPTFSIPPKQKEAVITGRAAAQQVSVCAWNVYCVFLNRNLELYASAHETITLKDKNGAVVDSYSY